MNSRKIVIDMKTASFALSLVVANTTSATPPKPLEHSVIILDDFSDKIRILRHFTMENRVICRAGETLSFIELGHKTHDGSGLREIALAACHVPADDMDTILKRVEDRLPQATISSDVSTTFIDRITTLLSDKRRELRAED